jgi:hypothetical protein
MSRLTARTRLPVRKPDTAGKQERDKHMHFTRAVTRSNSWKRLNITTGTIFASPWKRIKPQYVSLVCGLALAIVAIGYGGLQEAGSGGRNAPATGGGGERVRQTTRGTGLIYIVGSQAESDRVLAEAAEVAHLLLASGQEPGQVSAIVAFLGGEFDDHMVAGMLADANSGLVVNTKIVDLR